MVKDEVIEYMKGADVYESSFKDILSIGDLYLEDACKLGFEID